MSLFHLTYSTTSAATCKPNLEIQNYTIQNQMHNINQEDNDVNESNKQNTIWTKNAILMLLNLYEIKMPLLDNPKKKSKMWASIASELKSLNIVVTPDQVRWKINALTKKYKDSIDGGQGSNSFTYFNEMHQILGRYNENGQTYRLASGIAQPNSGQSKRNISLKTPYRKLREERKAKVELDKKWIEYLKKQEEHKIINDQRCERILRLKEEELQLRKKEVELKHTLTLKKLLLKERKQEELLKIEKEKCALLRQLLADQ